MQFCNKPNFKYAAVFNEQCMHVFVTSYFFIREFVWIFWVKLKAQWISAWVWAEVNPLCLWFSVFYQQLQWFHASTDYFQVISLPVKYKNYRQQVFANTFIIGVIKAIYVTVLLKMDACIMIQLLLVSC